MPVATDHRTPMRPHPGTAPRLARPAASSGDAGPEVAPAPGDPGRVEAVRCAIRHLEDLCSDLSATAIAIAHAAASDPARGPFTVAAPAARATTAWRLYDASHAFRAAGEACAAAAAVADGLEPTTEQRGR
jgi:hypothetical protein